MLTVLLLSSCGNSKSIGIIGGADGPTAILVTNSLAEGLTKNTNSYIQISAEGAKQIMDSDEDFIILDTREQYEYDEEHIPGAILIPYTEIDAKAAELLPDKNQLILVYCRSGRRSKIAAESLVNLGYTNIVEFGGIIDWPYETEKAGENND